MNTAEILTCVKQDKYIAPYILGVYPRDKLPKSNTLPYAIVANTDVSTGPGEHWVAIYVPIDDEPIYFDSYGLPPQQQEFVDYMGSPYTHNKVQLQSPFTSTCGQYAIFFLAMVCRGYTMKEIQNVFDKNDFPANGEFVTMFVNSNYDVKTQVFDVEFLVKQVCNMMNKNFI